MTKIKSIALVIFLILGLSLSALDRLSAQPFSLPTETRQVIVGLSQGWNDSYVTLQRWEKSAAGWTVVGKPISGRLGTAGLAWGRGLHPEGLTGGGLKVEGDKRAPAGVFSLGEVYTYTLDVQCAASLKVNQVTEQDMWVEDPTSEFYNRHLQLPGRAPQTEWEKKQQMNQKDPAHKLKLFINHNSGSMIKKGAGSSIFFHIWRDNGARASSGCTVMGEPSLRELIAWLDPRKNPVYVLLPQQVYVEKKKAWGLP